MPLSGHNACEGKVASDEADLTRTRQPSLTTPGPYIARGQRGQLPPPEKLNSVSNITLITRKSIN